MTLCDKNIQLKQKGIKGKQMNDVAYLDKVQTIKNRETAS